MTYSAHVHKKVAAPTTAPEISRMREKTCLPDRGRVLWCPVSGPVASYGCCNAWSHGSACGLDHNKHFSLVILLDSSNSSSPLHPPAPSSAYPVVILFWFMICVCSLGFLASANAGRDLATGERQRPESVLGGNPTCLRVFELDQALTMAQDTSRIFRGG